MKAEAPFMFISRFLESNETHFPSCHQKGRVMVSSPLSSLRVYVNQRLVPFSNGGDIAAEEVVKAGPVRHRDPPETSAAGGEANYRLVWSRSIKPPRRGSWSAKEYA